MIWVSIAILVTFFAIKFFRDRNRMLTTMETKHGGVSEKYSELIDWIIADSDAKVVNQSRDHVSIYLRLPSTSTLFLITETFSGATVEWRANYGILGEHKLKWNFSKNATNDEIKEKIGIDLSEYSEKNLF